MSAARVLANPWPEAELSVNAMTVIALVREALDLDLPEKGILLLLASRIGGKGYDRMTYDQIAADAGCVPSTAVSVVKSLVGKGLLLKCTPPRGRGQFTRPPNVYAIDQEALKKWPKRRRKAEESTVLAPESAEVSLPEGASTEIQSMHSPQTSGCHPPPTRGIKTRSQNAETKERGERASATPQGCSKGTPDPRETPAAEAPEAAKAPAACGLKGWFLEAFQQAWAVRHDAPAVDRGQQDLRHASIVVQAAQAQASAQHARCSARGEALPDLDDLARDCLRAQIDAYLATSGRVSDRYPQGFLVFRKHPLSAMVDDLEQLPTPWAADEERRKKEAQRAQQEAEQEARRARTLEADRARQQRVVRLHAPSLVLASPPAPAAPAPSLAAVGALGLALAPTPALPLAPAPGAHSSLASDLAANESAPASLPSLPAVAFARHDALTPEQQQQADYQARLRAALDATERTDLARLEAIPPHERTASQRRWLANLLSRGVLALEALDACKVADA